MAGPFLWLFGAIVQLVIIVLIVNAVISWLVAFDIVSRRNAFVAQIWDVTQRLADPLLKPVRRVIPAVGGLDLSPIVLILGLLFLDRVLRLGACSQGWASGSVCFM
jgi:YggT family protein